MIHPVFGHTILDIYGGVVLWGFVATVAMTTILQGAQSFGFSRLSLPLLMGTFFVRSRRRAMILGFILYVLGGWVYAFFYFFIFVSVHDATWWFGALLGVAHGLFLLVTALPLLPYIHPLMASEYHGVTALRRLEPPGFFGLNYGYRTPVSTLLAQAVYGGTLGALLHIGHRIPF